MRCFAPLLLALLCPPASAGTAPEEVAAMLLSPDVRLRRTAMAEAAGWEGEIMEHVARWGYRRGAWIAQLEERLKTTTGVERQRVQRMLEHLGSAQDAHVGVDFYLFSVPKVVAARILGRGSPTVLHGKKSGMWEQWWKWLGMDKRVDRRFGRAIAGRDQRPGSVQVVRQISYVKDFKADVPGTGGGSLDPVIGIVQAGVDIRWTPRLSEDHERVGLEMEITVVDVALPMKRVEIVRAGQKVEIQKPEVTKTMQQKLLGLEAGGHAAWRVPNGKIEAQDRVLLVLLRANLGRPDAQR